MPPPYFCDFLDKRHHAAKYVPGFLGHLNQIDRSHKLAHIGDNSQIEEMALHSHYVFRTKEDWLGPRLIKEYKKAFDILSQMNNKYICDTKSTGNHINPGSSDNAWLKE